MREKNDEGITHESSSASPDANAGDTQRGPLDGSVSGTIGGGGPESGGPSARPSAPDMPDVKPANAASGRRAPDVLGATEDPDELKPGASDVTNH